MASLIGVSGRLAGRVAGCHGMAGAEFDSTLFYGTIFSRSLSQKGSFLIQPSALALLKVSGRSSLSTRSQVGVAYGQVVGKPPLVRHGANQPSIRQAAQLRAKPHGVDPHALVEAWRPVQLGIHRVENRYVKEPK